MRGIKTGGVNGVGIDKRGRVKDKGLYDQMEGIYPSEEEHVN